MFGYNNSAGAGAFVFGYSNYGGYAQVLGSNNQAAGGTVIGNSNSSQLDGNNNIYIFGDSNNITGGYAVGENNKVNGNSFAFGAGNSAMNGSTTFGKNNTGDSGARVFGDDNSANYGAAIFGNWGNTANYGAIVVGWSNYASYGGGAFGNGNYAGKGGWAIGESNRPYKYNSDTSSYESVNTDEGSNFPSQYAFGYSNAVYYDKNKTNTIGLPVQIGYGNKTYHFLDYNGTTYYNNAGYQPLSIYNIGFSNSAVERGINIGSGNIILTGDYSVGASINIGKGLVNRYGVLIGQNITSYGYGFGFGSEIEGVDCGDVLIGFGIHPQDPGWRFSSRTILGHYIYGQYTNDASVFGSYITSHSGIIPNRTNWSTYGVGNDAIIIGSHIKCSVGAGSILVGQNAGEDAAYAGPNDSTTVPIIVTGDSMVFGGYTKSYYQSASYINPGISAAYNGIIFGQGQQMSAGYNSLILGNESYAYQNGKVLGSHGYATNDSMVINYPSLYLHSQNVGVYTINGKPISGNIQINYKPYKNRYNNVRYVNYYYDENNNLVMSANTSNVFSGEYLDDSLYYRNHYYLESNDKNYAVAVFNLDSYYSQDNIVTGSWINDGKDFQVDSTGSETAYKLTGWSGNPMILINDNGTRNFYVYNDLSDADKASMPHYFKIRKTFYGYYNNVLVTDKKYLYVFNIDTTLYKMESDVPSSLLCTSSEINSVLRLNYQTVYLYNDNTFSIGERQLITGYEWSGESASQLGYVNSSVYPSAIFSADPRQVVTNSTADQASLAIGPGNSAIGGSVAINGCTKWNHNIVNSADQYYYNTSSLNPTGGLIQTYNSAISNTNLINDPLNKASYNSISMGIGTKGGWQNSASNYSLAIGSKVTAGWNSIAIGQTLSATDYSYAFGTNAVTADNFSFGIGANGVSSNDFSYAIGHDGISADRHSFVFGTHGVNAENNGFAFGGQGITARNQGMAFGFYGVIAENIDQNYNGYGQGWGIAIGSNGVTSRNGGIAFGYNGVYSENRGCIAIGASGVNATGFPAFAIGSNGVEAYQGLSFGVKGKARNQSINLTMSNLNSYFASVAENVSINMITTEDYNNTTARNHSINIGTTRHGNSYSENGSITLMADANYDGYYSVTNRNQSIVLATKHYIGDGDYLYANNNSLIIGAGTDNTTASNDSIAISLGREIYTNNSQTYNGSITIGHANTVNGGVWLIGSKNYMGTTYTANDGTHPIEYTQTIVMGESNTAYNYRPYLYAPYSAYSADKYLSGYNIISTDTNKMPHGWTYNNGSVTRSMIIGNYNSLTGYNSFIFGLNNTAGMSIYNYDSENDKLSGDPNDDGFVYIFGLNNRAYRNYDMAIGYGAVAYGGENITIGTNYEYNDGVGIRLYNYPSAVGFRNISIRSNLTGSDNLAIISNILGTGVSSNLEYFLNTHDNYSTNFLRNQIFDSMPIINGNAYSINNNIFDFVKATTITPTHYFDRNTLRNVISTNIIMSDGGTDNIYHNVLNSNIVSQKDSYNTYSNVISSTIDTSNAWCNSFSVYKNVTHMNLTVNSTAGSNLIYDVGGYFNDFDNGINLTASCFAKNIIMNAGIYGTCNEYGGFCNNFIWKCYINPYNSTASGQSQISTYSDMISENMLIGTEAYNTVTESFSFGGLYGSNIPLTASGYSFGAPILRDCNRVYNFGDNKIIHGFDTFVVGVSNEISGTEKYNILGSNNFVMSRQKDTYGYNSDNFHDSVILGNCNAIAATDNNYVGYYNDRDFILGALNTIIVRGSSNTATQANGDLTIIGGKNHYAGLTGFMNSVIAGTNNGGAYNWMRSYEYGSILPVTDPIEGDGDANQLFQRYSAYAGSGMARNAIIGNHSVIGSNITDSTIIGGNNTIYQDDQTYNIKFNNINVIGSYNIGINGSNQFNVGFNNITSGHHSTAIGEELRANAFQTILGKYNTSAEGTTRTTMRWNSATNTVEQVENTGVLLAVGNGRLNAYEKLSADPSNTGVYNSVWYDANGTKIDEYLITTDTYVQRSNAMIVSADGTVSARRFIESEPALTITGGDFVTVTEDTTNNKLVIDLESSLGQLLTELSGVLTAKPSTGRHILGVDGGTLTWLEVNQ